MRRVLTPLAGLLLCACAATSALAGARQATATPAPGGRSAACAGLVAQAPASLLGRPRDAPPRAGAVSWGSGRAELRCGVEELSPTADPCIEVDGVDWVLDEHLLNTDSTARLTTYGRRPASEFTYHGPREEVAGYLVSLRDAVRAAPRTEHKCVSLSEVG
ncbi:DUF3515 family protein [Streptomyces sp. SPB074]|uniref:DUF3515 family protein n=1 Tax=Streptomyces sp. (strain SPB074) TaxID=465543 RepID=UPI00017FEFBD|nr:DUF3515 family protein [Streptomyces sp. SPB074]EDY46438.1 secreted protein [Streptomyces sp. SPB074]